MSLLLCMLITLNVSAPPILVDTGDLARLERFIAVDARDAEAFSAGHIPGAAHLDVESLSGVRDGVTGMLRPFAELVPLFATAGLDPRHAIVIYSGDGEAGLKRATRLFWVLEYAGYPDVRLLNGGLTKWQAEARPIETGASTVQPAETAPIEGLDAARARIATRDDVKDFQAQKKGIIADLRSPSDFAGTSKKDFVERGGHIPGADSYPAPSFVEGPYGTFKSPEAIREMLDTGMPPADTPVLTYCNTGRDATIGYVAYRLAGFDDVAVYDGSMAEWGNRADCPIAAGPGK